jgi:hypothetical protein
MAVALLVAAGGVFGAVLGTQVVDSMESTFVEQLDLTEASLEATNDTVAAAQEAVTELAAALDGAATTALIVGGALEATTDLLDEVSVLLGEDVPATIESFRATIPGLISTAEAIDATLRAIDIFTTGDYDPEVPLDEAIADLDSNIAELPDDLRAQAALLRQANGTLVGVSRSMEQTAQDVVEVRAALTRAGRVLEEQERATDDALDDADALWDDLAQQFDRAGTVVIVMGAALAASQVGSFAFGWFLVAESRKDDDGDEAEADPDEVRDE